MHPLGRNKIFVRIENLADRFDVSREGETPIKYVNLMKFAKNFWQQANAGVKQNMTITFEERAITDFGAQADLQKEVGQREKWIGIGDELINATTLLQQPQDISNTALAFEPQRIRSFIISYKKTMTPQDVKESEAATAKAKEDASKVVNLGKNGQTNIDRITTKIDKQKIKLDQTVEGHSFVQSQLDQLDQFQQMPSQEFELVRITN